ncbi:hypothetical protein GCM10010275_23840 [Streptomyces litmocidini]|nr:hypothetical protein GCM10010275_23840 [Streptomyces litmocidini]
MFAAADEDGLGPEGLAVAEVEAALFAQGEDRADEVLAVAHAPGDAVHGDADCPACHEGFLSEVLRAVRPDPRGNRTQG